MRISFIIAGLLCLSATGVAHAATLEFPDLGLSSSPHEVRTWAQEHGFTSAHPAEPDQEAYQDEFADGQRESVSFVPGRQGLEMLKFEQTGVLEGAPTLRRKVYERFGKPEKDQIVEGSTLRLTYTYDHSEPARRVFLLQPHYVSMYLMTEAYVARLDQTQARDEIVKEQAKQAAGRAARNAWLVPVLWIGGIFLGLAALIRVMPRAVRDPVTQLARSILNSLFELTQEVLTFLFYQASGFLLYGLFILSGLAVGAGAAEWGTSWWWTIPWIFGVVTTYKAHDEDFFPWAFVAIGFFAITMVGVFFQGSWTDSIK